MGPSSWFRDQRRVHGMETQGIPYFQKIPCAKISRKDHGNSFWDSEGVLFLEFIATQDNHDRRHLCFQNSSFTREYETETPRRGKLSAGVLLLHDHAPALKSRTSRAAINKCGFVELKHPPRVQISSQSLLSLQKLYKISEWATISRWQCSQGSCNRVLRYSRSFFFSEGIRSLVAKWTVLQSRGTTLKNNAASLIIKFNIHVQADNLLNALRICPVI